MRILAIILACAFLTTVIGVSDANAVRRGAMSGYDNTYGSTGKCVGGACILKNRSAVRRMQ
jgi:hypothetical protein